MTLGRLLGTVALLTGSLTVAACSHQTPEAVESEAMMILNVVGSDIAADSGLEPREFEAEIKRVETGVNAHWLLSKILCYLTHLRALGKASSIGGEPERWTA